MGTATKERETPPTGEMSTMGRAGDTTADLGKAREVLDFSIPLPGAALAVLSIPVPLTQHDFTRLEAWLTWAKDSLVVQKQEESQHGAD